MREIIEAHLAEEKAKYEQMVKDKQTVSRNEPWKETQIAIACGQVQYHIDAIQSLLDKIK